MTGVTATTMPTNTEASTVATASSTMCERGGGRERQNPGQVIRSGFHFPFRLCQYLAHASSKPIRKSLIPCAIKRPLWVARNAFQPAANASCISAWTESPRPRIAFFIFGELITSSKIPCSLRKSSKSLPRCGLGFSILAIARGSSPGVLLVPISDPHKEIHLTLIGSAIIFGSILP